MNVDYVFVDSQLRMKGSTGQSSWSAVLSLYFVRIRKFICL